MQVSKNLLINFLFISLFFLLFGAKTIIADEVNEIREMTKKKVEHVISTLKDKSLSKEDKTDAILKTVEGFFDLVRMAKLSLGKKHWKSLSKDGRKEFSKLFVEKLKQSYMDKLDLYTDEEVVVDEAKRKKKNRVEVLTYLMGKDDKMEMKYKLYKSRKKGWMVYDVEVLGVSIVQTYRSQFSGFLKKGCMDDLMNRLRSLEDIEVAEVKTECPTPVP